MLYFYRERRRYILDRTSAVFIPVLCPETMPTTFQKVVVVDFDAACSVVPASGLPDGRTLLSLFHTTHVRGHIFLEPVHTRVTNKQFL